MHAKSSKNDRLTMIKSAFNRGKRPQLFDNDQKILALFTKDVEKIKS